MACTWTDIVLVLVAAYVFLRYWYQGKVDKIRSYGLNFIQPTFLLGNSKDSLLGTKHSSAMAIKLYNAFPEDRYVVMFEMASPIIFLRDLDLIKKITIESFDHFPNHRVFVDKDIDVLFGRSLFSLKDTEWREMRATVSPAFTPSRMKKMSVRLIKAAFQMKQHFLEVLTEKQHHNEHPVIVDLDGKNSFMTYFIDLTAMAGFGLDINSFADRNKTFMKQAKSVAEFDYKAIILLFGFITMPKLMKILKMQFRNESALDFFKKIVVDTITYREKNNIKTIDFLDLIIDMQKGNFRSKFTQTKTDNNIISDDWDQITDENNNPKKTNWSELDITVQAMSFMVAGLDSSSANTEFLFFELAQNPDVQRRLQDEVDEAIATHGEITYDVVQGMVYLNMAVSETLRKYGTFSERICEKDINLGPVRPGGKSYTIRKGDGVIISGYSVQRDPKYWPDPLKFDPERFSKANRHNIVPYSYFPFGLGPRICVAGQANLLPPERFNEFCRYINPDVKQRAIGTCTIHVSSATDEPARVQLLTARDWEFLNPVGLPVFQMQSDSSDLPFGSRFEAACAASTSGFRFAELAMKLAAVSMVSAFDIVPTEKTPKVLEICPKSLIPRALNPHIGLKLRAS